MIATPEGAPRPPSRTFHFSRLFHAGDTLIRNVHFGPTDVPTLARIGPDLAALALAVDDARAWLASELPPGESPALGSSFTT
jgi:hypothetical protein